MTLHINRQHCEYVNDALMPGGRLWYAYALSHLINTRKLKQKNCLISKQNNFHVHHLDYYVRSNGIRRGHMQEHIVCCSPNGQQCFNNSRRRYKEKDSSRSRGSQSDSTASCASYEKCSCRYEDRVIVRSIYWYVSHCV